MEEFKKQIEKLNAVALKQILSDLPKPNISSNHPDDFLIIRKRVLIISTLGRIGKRKTQLISHIN